MKRNEPVGGAIFNLLFYAGLVTAIALIYGCKSHRCALCHKPHTEKIYNIHAGQFDYERWHGEEDNRLNCEK